MIGLRTHGAVRSFQKKALGIISSPNEDLLPYWALCDRLSALPTSVKSASTHHKPDTDLQAAGGSRHFSHDHAVGSSPFPRSIDSQYLSKASLDGALRGVA